MTETTKPLTPEQHHDQLMEEIKYELATYGARSLAAVIATILEDTPESEVKDTIPTRSPAEYARQYRAIEND